MSERVEGTFTLDGLLEGRLGDEGFGAAELRSWAARAGDRGLHFSVEVEGNVFSVLGVRRAVSTADLGDEPSRAVAGALEDLLDEMPPDTRAGAMSTLRSIEYRKGEQVQTLYVLTPAGLDVRQRRIDAETVSPAPPMTGKQKLRLALTGLGVAALALLVSSVFVDYRALLGRVADSMTPVSADDIAVDVGPFATSFSVDKKAIAKGSRALVLTLKRGEGFPLSDQDIQKRCDEAKDVRARLTAEALARGYVRCECFDKEGKYLYSALVRVAGLRKKTRLEIALGLPKEGPRVAKVAFTY